MLNGEIRPSTVEGIKSLAAQLKKQQGIQHASALDLAARAARCENFTHAIRVLPSRQEPQRIHRVFLTVYWIDDETYTSGRETLQIELSRPILDICPKTEIRHARGFGTMRMVAEDHFVCDLLASNQPNAQERICKAERSLRFMEHTGLRPSKDHRAAYPDRTHDSRLPDTDHATDWYDPMSGQFVLVDEPYPRATESAERSAWARRHGWHLAKAAWPGMYYPHGTEMHVATSARTSYDFAALMAKIDAMPSPLIQKDWSGDSAPGLDTFVSPAGRSPQDRRRARSKGTVFPVATDTTIPYTMMFGAQRRRPAGQMPIREHAETGRQIKSILGSRARPWSVHRRMDALRSTLEDWMALEIGKGELDGPEFFDVYYHELDDADPLAQQAATPEGVLAIMNLIGERLRASYPDCAPLRAELSKLATSRKLMERHATRARAN